MSENPVEYKVDRPIRREPFTDEILSSLYAQTVIRIAEAAIASKLVSHLNVFDFAIKFTDRLIEAQDKRIKKGEINNA